MRVETNLKLMKNEKNIRDAVLAIEREAFM
jgi:hypothetical protein